MDSTTVVLVVLSFRDAQEAMETVDVLVRSVTKRERHRRRMIALPRCSNSSWVTQELARHLGLHRDEEGAPCYQGAAVDENKKKSDRTQKADPPRAFFNFLDDTIL